MKIVSLLILLVFMTSCGNKLETPKLVKVEFEGKEVLKKLHYTMSRRGVDNHPLYNQTYNELINKIDVNGDNKISNDEMESFFEIDTNEATKQLYEGRYGASSTDENK